MKDDVKQLFERNKKILKTIEYLVQEFLLVFFTIRGIFWTYTGVWLRLDLPVSEGNLAMIKVATLLTALVLTKWIKGD